VIQITKEPITTLPNGISSTWNAGSNAIVFELTTIPTSPPTPYQSIVVQVIDIDNNLLGQLEVFPDFNTGKVTFSVNEFVNTEVDFSQDWAYNLGAGVSLPSEERDFYIAARYKDGSGLVESRFFQVNNAAKQIGNVNNGNLLEHVCQVSNTSPIEKTEAKFMTRSRKTVLFRGYPFDVSIINRSGTDAQTVQFNTQGAQIANSFYIIGSRDKIRLSPNEPLPEAAKMWFFINFDGSLVDNIVTEDFGNMLIESGALILPD
jgi:hypothetical protein